MLLLLHVLRHTSDIMLWSLSDIKGRGVFWQVSAWEMQARKAVEEVGVRVVDSAGGPSNAGLLQVQIGDGQFGTVCGMDLAAVDVVCRQLGDAYVASGGHWHLCVGLWWQAMTTARSRLLRVRATAEAALVGLQGALCPCEGWRAEAAS